MQRVLIGELHDHIGETVTVAGWVDVRRDHGKITFIDLRDRSGLLQTVVTPATPAAHTTAKESRSEWVIEMTGVVKKRPEKMVNAELATGDIEMEATAIEVLTRADELPFDHDAELNIDTLLDHRPLTLRRARERAIFKVQAEIVRAYREYLRNNDFVEFQAPKIVGGDAEGGAEVFKFEYFKDRPASLATSPQLYKQIMVGAYERVFATGSTFRAEKHATTRHLNEITMLDAEMGFINDQFDVMTMLSGAMHAITAALKEHCADEYKVLETTLPDVPEKFPHLTLREAQKLISDDTGEDCTSAPDLEPSHERWLCEYAKKEFKSDFIYVTNFPISKRPFYTMEDPGNPGFARCFDLLFRGVEISSGNQRVHDYATLVEKMRSKDLRPDDFSFYLQAFKFGLPPHGGWGMGLERLTWKFLSLGNVKEATLFPRDINRIDTLLGREE